MIMDAKTIIEMSMQDIANEVLNNSNQGNEFGIGVKDPQNSPTFMAFNVAGHNEDMISALNLSLTGHQNESQYTVEKYRYYYNDSVATFVVAYGEKPKIKIAEILVKILIHDALSQDGLFIKVVPIVA